MNTQLDAFISYTSRDLPQVQIITEALRVAGLQLLIDIHDLTAGKPWQPELVSALNRCRACIAIIGPGERGPWQQREIQLALNRQAHEPEFVVIPVLLPGADPSLGFLGLNTWIDLRNGMYDALRISMLVRAVRDGHDEPIDGPWIRNATSPYRGLLQFREEDAPLFFGRDSTTARLQEAIHRHNFVAVIGASGSGKSSILKAGLLSKLRQERQVAWEVVSITPTERPFHALAGAFVRLLRPEDDPVQRRTMIDTTAEGLRKGTIEIEDLVSDVLSQQIGTDRLLLVVDQWEELCTLATTPEISGQFVSKLLKATKKRQHPANPRLTIIVAVGGDFIGAALLSNRALADTLDGATVNVGPMTLDEVQSAIVEPARVLGMSFEEGLVERICEQVGTAPGQLPLLEFLLQQLWERRNGSVMHHSAFEAVGGLNGAVARHADQLLNRLSDDEQRITRVLFTHIVRTSDGSEATSRRTRIADLPDSAQKLAHWFANERMVVTSRSLDGGGDTVEIAHEALIRSWVTLRQWLQEDRSFLLWRERLLTLLSTWRLSGSGAKQRDNDALLRGLLLEESLLWRDARESALSVGEIEFIDASRRQREADINADADRQRREVERERALLTAESARLEASASAQEKSRRLTTSIGALAVTVGLGCAALIGTIHQVQRAREQFSLTEAAKLQSSRLAEAYPAVDSCQLIVGLVRTMLTGRKPSEIRSDDQHLIGNMIDDYRGRFSFLTTSTQDLVIRIGRLTAEGDGLMAQGNPDAALNAYRAAAAIAERATQESPTTGTFQQVARSHIKVGEALVRKGEAKDARAEYAAAQKILESLASRHEPSANLQELQTLLRDRLKALK